MATALSHSATFHHQPATMQSLGYLSRPKVMPLSFLIPIIFTGISWAADGLPFMTDVGFILLTVVCAGWLIEELWRFPRRFGVGGLLLFGGTILWFCIDYLEVWFGRDFSDSPPFPAKVIAKAAFFHCIFVMMMAYGLMLRRGRFMVRLLQAIPEPNSRDFYFLMMILLTFLGLVPFIFFSRDPLLVSIYKTIIAGRTGGGARLTIGRTGALNVYWGGYILEFIKLGRIAGVFAAVYAVLVAETGLKKTIAWSIWALWLLMSFGGGNRGHVAVVGLPAIFLLFLKYHAVAAQHFQKFSVRAYLLSGLTGLVVLTMVQIQAEHRNEGFQNVVITDTNLTDLKGNNMFSEGMAGWATIPATAPFISNSWVGEGLLKAIPETLFYIIIHPIPRALWHDKPIDPLWTFYNTLTTGRGSENTTVSKGLVGSWYFRYGLLGMLQGGLFVGWLIGCAEWSIQEARGRVMVILVALAFLTWLFRCFRDFAIPELWEVGVSMIVIYVLVRGYNIIQPHRQPA